MDQKTYNSAVSSKHLTLTAPYFNAIVPTTVEFLQEGISVSVDSLGHIAFFDGEMTPLGTVDLPVHKDPSAYAHSAQYGNMELSADGKSVTIHLPIYYWLDSYPNCDGESDRWDRRISRWFRVVFNCAAREIAILDREAE